MSKKSPLSDEDKKLFQAAMRGVKPLASNTTSRQLQKKPIEERKATINESLKKPAAPPASNYPLSNFVANPVNSESILTYAKPGLLPSQYKRLKQGLIPIDAILDLHGSTGDSAATKLCQFIDAAHNSGKRCLLIIHGKGGKHGDVPVLKNLVHTWLCQLPSILAFHSAKPQHGGAGALYVLLNR